MPKQIADQTAIEDCIDRMADALCERVADPARLAFIGIHTHGVPLAKRLKEKFESRCGTEAQFGTLDITLYRDDYDLRGVKPRIQSSKIRFTLEGLEVILVDDVLYTGRTIRAAIEALGDYGRPNAIRLAVLADRGHRELPIQADFVGFVFETEKSDLIRVRMKEIDDSEEILLLSGSGKNEQ
jgi:pyrimidine operon attenuation protein/uracil phosphoribosyltransferase